MFFIDAVFPDNLKFIGKGNYLKDYLYGKALNIEKEVPIDFNAKDINGQAVTLSNLRIEEMSYNNFGPHGVLTA